MKKWEIIGHARRIGEKYKAMSPPIDITLRGVFYQFVSEGLWENTNANYRTLGETIAKARLAGRFPLNLLVDNMRDVKEGDFIEHSVDVDYALVEAREQVEELEEWVLRSATWFGQKRHVSVWIEKDALAPVIRPVCESLGVSWLACRGYPSVTVLNEWLSSADEFYADEPPLILYFGDHDPEGFNIPVSAVANVRKLIEVRWSNVNDGYENTGMKLDYVEDVELVRVALNMDQIQLYDPPPTPAKKKSARFAKYEREHGTDQAWELDALDPAVLQTLVRDNVRPYFEREVFDANQVLVRERRVEFRGRFAAELRGDGE